jgi:HNH endonuclease
MAATHLTAARLREVLHYDPDSGLFTWLIQARATRPPGSNAGSRYDRYVKIGIDQERHSAHRLAWLYMTGKWPTHEIDHINRDGFDNRWANLRDVPKSVNARNIVKHNNSGFRGVKKNRGKTWRSIISVEGRPVGLGNFLTPEDAQAAFLEANSILDGGSAKEALLFAAHSRRRCTALVQSTKLRIEVGGVSMSVPDAAKALGIPERTAYYRLQGSRKQTAPT